MYHSSLKDKNAAILSGFEYRETEHIFYHDLSSELIPDVFKDADCIYSEPAWPYGYRIFNERAGYVVNGAFKFYAQNINKVAKELGKPAFITGGKIHERYFKDASKVVDIVITHDGKKISDALLYIYNTDNVPDVKTTEELTDWLSEKFNCPLDFSCGYGEHLLKFKDFIATDINKDCLAYLQHKKEERDHDNKH